MIKRSNEAAKGDIFHVSSNSPPLMCSLCWNVKGWLCIHNWLRVIWAAVCVCVYVCFSLKWEMMAGDISEILHTIHQTTQYNTPVYNWTICSCLIYIIVYMETFHSKPAFAMHHNSMLYALWFLYTTHCAALFCNHITHRW